MAKKNKSVLNQNVVEPIEEIKDIVVEEFETNDLDISIKKDLSELTNDDAPQYPLEVKEVVPVEVKKIEPVVVKPKRTIDSLSKAEYRTYLRTGKIPE